MNSSVRREPREKLFTKRSRSDFRSGDGELLSRLVFLSSAMRCPPPPQRGSAKYRSAGARVIIVWKETTMSDSADANSGNAGLPGTPEPVDELLEAGQLDQARELLAQVPPGDERFAVVRVKLGLMDGTLPAGAAQQALIK